MVETMMELGVSHRQACNETGLARMSRHLGLGAAVAGVVLAATVLMAGDYRRLIAHMA